MSSVTMHALWRMSRHAATQHAHLLSTPKAPSPTLPSQCTSTTRPRSQPTFSSRSYHDSTSSTPIPATTPKHSKQLQTFQVPKRTFLPTTTTKPLSYRTLSATASNHTSPPPPAPHVTEPSPLSIDQYHALSDAYIDSLVAQLEEMQEEREEVDVEYSAGVLTLMFPPCGTYVLNKQPPNKQIWLSSPVSGPKRYDWVERAGEAGHTGHWTYLRDGSTLDALLEEEVGVDMKGA